MKAKHQAGNSAKRTFRKRERKILHSAGFRGTKVSALFAGTFGVYLVSPLLEPDWLGDLLLIQENSGSADWSPLRDVRVPEKAFSASRCI